jgi:hypothetical protein
LSQRKNQQDTFETLKQHLAKANYATYQLLNYELTSLAGIRIDVKGLDELQRKLRQFPNEIERIRREIFARYGRKIELEAKDACPDQKLKDSVEIVFLANGDFKVKYSVEAESYVKPIIERNTEEMHREIAQRIGDVWRE